MEKTFDQMSPEEQQLYMAALKQLAGDNPNNVMPTPKMKPVAPPPAPARPEPKPAVKQAISMASQAAAAKLNPPAETPPEAVDLKQVLSPEEKGYNDAVSNYEQSQQKTDLLKGLMTAKDGLFTTGAGIRAKHLPDSSGVVKNINPIGKEAMEAAKLKLQETLKSKALETKLSQQKEKYDSDLKYKDQQLDLARNRENRLGGNFNTNQIRNIQKETEDDPVIKDGRMSNAAIDKLLNAADEWKKVGKPLDRILLSNAAKVLGRDVGNIAIQEAEGILNRTFHGDIQQLANYLDSDAMSTITDKQRSQLVELFRKAKAMNSVNIQKTILRKAYLMEQRLGIPREQGVLMLSQPSDMGEIEEKAPAPKAEAKPAQETAPKSGFKDGESKTTPDGRTFKRINGQWVEQ